VLKIINSARLVEKVAVSYLEAVLKTLLGFKVKAGPSVQPEEYTKYFED
jgi:hypothetical protein